MNELIMIIVKGFRKLVVGSIRGVRKLISANKTKQESSDVIVTSEDIESDTLEITDVHIEYEDEEKEEYNKYSPRILTEISPLTLREIEEEFENEELTDPYNEVPEDTFEYNCGQCFNCIYFNKEQEDYVLGCCSYHKHDMLEDDGCSDFNSKY